MPGKAGHDVLDSGMERETIAAGHCARDKRLLVVVIPAGDDHQIITIHAIDESVRIVDTA